MLAEIQLSNEEFGPSRVNAFAYPKWDLTAALKLEGEAGGGCGTLPNDGHGRSIGQRQHAIGNWDRGAQREVDLLGPAATKHGRPNDQPSGLDALNVCRATAVFDDAIRTHPGAIDRRNLSQPHRAFNSAARDWATCRAPGK